MKDCVGKRQTAGDDLCNLFVFVSHVRLRLRMYFSWSFNRLWGKQGKAIFDQVECSEEAAASS